MSRLNDNKWTARIALGVVIAAIALLPLFFQQSSAGHPVPNDH